MHMYAIQSLCGSGISESTQYTRLKEKEKRKTSTYVWVALFAVSFLEELLGAELENAIEILLAERLLRAKRLGSGSDRVGSESAIQNRATRCVHSLDYQMVEYHLSFRALYYLLLDARALHQSVHAHLCRHNNSLIPHYGQESRLQVSYCVNLRVCCTYNTCVILYS